LTKVGEEEEEKEKDKLADSMPRHFPEEMAEAKRFNDLTIIHLYFFR
jgi:hypothetical protein